MIGGRNILARLRGAKSARPAQPDEQPAHRRGHAPPSAIAAFEAAQDAVRRRISPAQGARMLVDFMQSEGQGGWHDHEIIDEYWRWLCQIEDIEPIRPTLIRCELRAIPGVGFLDRARIVDDPRFAAIRGRIKKDRATLYRIPARAEQIAAVAESMTGDRPAPHAGRSAATDTPVGAATQRPGGGTPAGTRAGLGAEAAVDTPKQSIRAMRAAKGRYRTLGDVVAITDRASGQRRTG